MVRLVNGAGTVVEVSDELASRLSGFKPSEKAEPTNPVKPVETPVKRERRAKKS